MRTFLKILLILFSQRIFAQQNFFNVPSSDLTEKGRLFFQQQMNLTGLGESNTTLTYGLQRKLEAGVNLNNVLLYDNMKSEENVQISPTSLLLNAQYLLFERSRFSITSGFQAGHFLMSQDYSAYCYANARYASLNKNVKLVTGIYYINHALSVTDVQGGLQTGADIVIKPEKLSMTIDCFHGRNALSLVTAGLTYFINRHALLSAGVQCPYQYEKNQRGFVLEFTLL